MTRWRSRYRSYRHEFQYGVVQSFVLAFTNTWWVVFSFIAATVTAFTLKVVLS